MEPSPTMLLVSENGAQLKSKSLNFEEAASFQTAYLTAYVSLVRRGELQPGESLHSTWSYRWCRHGSRSTWKKNRG